MSRAGVDSPAAEPRQCSGRRDQWWRRRGAASPAVRPEGDCRCRPSEAPHVAVLQYQRRRAGQSVVGGHEPFRHHLRACRRRWPYRARARDVPGAARHRCAGRGAAPARRSRRAPSATMFSARSMEIFRQLGVAAAVRDCGLPAEYPQRRGVSDDDDRGRTRPHPHSLSRGTVTPMRAARTAGGRRRSRRIGSTRSSSSPCCWHAAAQPRRSHPRRPAGRRASPRRARRAWPRARPRLRRAGAHRAALTSSAATAAGRRCARRSARAGGTDFVGPARAVDPHPRARAAGAAAVRAGLGDVSRSTRAAAATSTRSTAARPGWCTTTSRRRDRLRRGRPRLGHPHDPRRRRRLPLRGHRQGGLDRAPARGRSVPRPPRLHLRRRGAHLGARRPATA